MSNPARRLILIASSTLLLAASVILIAFVWHRLSLRRTLPFPLTSEPVVARRIYSFGGYDIEPPASAPRLDGYPVIGDPVIVPPDAAAQVRQILSSPSTFDFRDSSCFEPGMAISFGEDQDRVDVIICLLCDRMVFYRGNSQVGRTISGEGHNRLTSIYQRLFPSPPPQL